MGIGAKKAKPDAPPDSGGADSGGAGPIDPTHELSAAILRIFNQAYAAGRRDVARALIDALDVCLSAASAADTDATARRARMWIAFVHARDGYMASLHQRGADDAETATAARRMRESYLRWCDDDNAPG